MDSPLWIYCIGLAAQFFFTARIIVQWYLSERQHEVVSPSIFWIFSIIGSSILFFYGWLRADFAIVLGEFLSFYIYLWNIKSKGLLKNFPIYLDVLICLVPLILLAIVSRNVDSFSKTFFAWEDISPLLMSIGVLGQLVFKSRFIFQFLYSIKAGKSVLPLSFWVISVIGSLLISVYAVFRHDWVLLLGQLGIVASVRNLTISLAKQSKV